MELLALTISPRIDNADDTYLTSSSPDMAYWPQRSLIQRLLQRCSKDYKMFPEFSDSGHLHWHGYVLVHDTVKWFMQVIPTIVKRIGFIKVKPVKSLQAWLEYCTKSQEDMYRYIQDLIQEDEKIYIDSSIALKRKRIKGHIDTNHVRTLCDYGFEIYGSKNES